MDLLDGVIRSYDWGSATALADLRGIEPTGAAEAELWFGAHPSGPSSFRHGGRDVTLNEMPFLVKVLAVDQPLSLQVHPDASAAAIGHRRELAAGLAVDDRRRSHPDGRAKPEVICAIGRFETLCGFRSVDVSVAVATSLCYPEAILDPLRRADWRAVVAAALAASTDDVVAFVSAVGMVPDDRTDRSTADLVLRLAGMYPVDPALLLVPLLRHLVLDDGEALFVAPGVLHAHLSGLAVEVMAVSDDVVRAGLTPKHVDRDRVVELLGPVRSDEVEKAAGSVHRFAVGADACTLWRLDGDDIEVYLDDRHGPELVLCTAGSASVGVAGTDGPGLTVGPGEAAWIGPDDGPVRLRVDGTVHRVAVGKG